MRRLVLDSEPGSLDGRYVYRYCPGWFFLDIFQVISLLFDRASHSLHSYFPGKSAIGARLPLALSTVNVSFVAIATNHINPKFAYRF